MKGTYLWDDQVAVIKGCGVELDKHIMVAEFGYGGIACEFQAVETFTAFDRPLLLCFGRRHFVYSDEEAIGFLSR